MNKIFFTIVAVCGLALLSGCLGDPVSRTTYSVSPTSVGVARSQVEQTADQIVQAVAQAYELQLIENRVDEKGLFREMTYWDGPLGKNPNLYLRIRFGERSLRVDINEQYVSRPTSNQRKLVKDLKRRLEQAGLQLRKVDE